MTAFADFNRPQTSQEAVLDALRAAIAGGALQPGQQVVQEELAQRFGVSRVPIREALKILEGEGQVTYHPHRGYFVTELSIDNLVEIYRIRSLLETEAVLTAVPLLDDQDIERITVLLREVERVGRTGEIGQLTAANRSFHFALFEASAMPRLVRMIRILWDATDVYRSVYFGDRRNRRRVHDEHRALMAALRSRDPQGAAQVLDEHRDHAVTAISRRLARSGAN